MKVQSQFRLLLAQKEQAAGKSISLRRVARDTKVPLSTVLGLANNDIKRIELEAVAQICEYLGCNIGDLLVLVREPTPSA
jgi:DNA-binding Xre family transcriptional regulator